MAITPRNEMDERYKWRLEDMFASDAEWEKGYSEANAMIAKLPEFAGKLGDGPANLKNALMAQGGASLLVERLYVYSHMRKDEDNAVALYQGMSDRALSLSVSLASAASFLVPEIMEIPADVLDAWRALPEMSTYSHMLHDLLRSRAHVLSHAEENILAMTGEISSSSQTIYKMLDNADMTFPSVSTPSGEQEISHGSFIHLMQSSDRSLREQTFDKFYSSYSSFKNTYASALSGSVKGDVFYARVRKYPSALEASLFSDNVPVSVYDSLIDAVHEKLPAMHRYMALRAQALKIYRTHMYDLYAPLSDAEYDLSYDQAKELVLKGLAPLGESYLAMVRRAFDERWMDVYENRGKSSGAYCWGCYGTHPFLLLNYQPNIDSAFTIAHELGHAMHSYYSDAAQEYHNAQYAILVAEVASTVNEALLIDYMLSTETDKAKRLRLVNYYLEQFRTTVFRQVMFAEFEKIIHANVEKGEPLTAESLQSIYYALNQKYYGEGVEIDKLIDMEWARISHFYNSFYVYKYATGFSSAVAISRAIREEGAGALSRYMEFLSSGGSDYPLELLKRVGVDLTSPAPVVSALEVFEKTLDDLEALL